MCLLSYVYQTTKPKIENKTIIIVRDKKIANKYSHKIIGRLPQIQNHSGGP